MKRVTERLHPAKHLFRHGKALAQPRLRDVRLAHMDVLSDPQQSEMSLRIGEKSEARLTLSITPIGLLAVAALVSAILLSTRALVGTAIREGAAAKG